MKSMTWLSDTTVIVDGGKRRVFLKEDNSFVIQVLDSLLHLVNSIPLKCNSVVSELDQTIYDLGYSNGNNIEYFRVMQLTLVLGGLQKCLTYQNLSHNFI